MNNGADTCPFCRQILPGRAAEAALHELVAALRDQCAQNGYLISVDGRVDARAAAALLGVTEGCLRNWRYVDGGELLHFYRHGRAVSYSLVDLAQWVLDGRVED